MWVVEKRVVELAGGGISGSVSVSGSTGSSSTSGILEGSTTQVYVVGDITTMKAICVSTCAVVA